MSRVIQWEPKLSVTMVVRLYRADAEGREDDELLEDVGWRLLARAQDVPLVSES